METNAAYKEAFKVMRYLADNVKDYPEVKEIDERIRLKGDSQIIIEWDKLRHEFNAMSKEHTICMFSWFFIRYLNMNMLKRVLEADIENSQINNGQCDDLFLNSVNSHERLLHFLFEKGIIDFEKFKQEVEIKKIGFPENKVVKFENRALETYNPILSKELPQELQVNEAKQMHFNSLYTKMQLENIFNKLKPNYFHSGSNMDEWLYICGYNVEIKQKPLLNWINDQYLLATLVDILFDHDRKNLWAITEQVFLVKGNKPNTDSMKNALSKMNSDIKDKPQKVRDLELLLKI